MGYGSYAAYLASPHWKAIRARYRDADLPQECICGQAEQLQLHHKTYERVGAELLTDLVPLCPRCHEMIHRLERRGHITLDFEGLIDEARGAVARQDAAERAEQRMVEGAEEREAFRVHLHEQPFDIRLRLVMQRAQLRRIDISREVHILKRKLRDDPRHRIESWLERMELIVYHELGPTPIRRSARLAAEQRRRFD